MCGCSPIGRPLTTEDISKLLEGVNCLKDGGLGEQLRVPRDTLNKIKTKYPNDQAEQAEQTRATVDSWLSVDCCYSWRRLVTALENIELPNSEERKAINSVKLHVEPLKGKYCMPLYVHQFTIGAKPHTSQLDDFECVTCMKTPAVSTYLGLVVQCSTWS